MPLKDTEARRAYVQAYYQANKEKRREQNKKYREANAKQLAEYYAKNKEARYQSARKWHADNKDLAAERYRKWAQENPGKCNARNAKRKAAELRATPPWANMVCIREIYERASFLTKTTGVVHHVDHIVPLQSRTVCGLHVPANLRVVTGAENTAKGNRFWPHMP